MAITTSLTPTPTDWTTLASWPDAPAFDMVSQTMLTATVTLPATPSAHAILRVRYVSYNKLEVDPVTNTDAIFYNCADIAIVAGVSAPAPAAAPVAAAIAAASPYNCTTPKAWAANFTESNAWGFVQHSVWWDSGALATRWDKTGNLDASGPSSLSLINDYTKPVEWVYFVSQDVCEMYGNDAFYPWAYGSLLNMAYSGRTSSGIDEWVMAGGNGEASFLTQDLGDGTCKPVAWTHGEASVTLTGWQAGPIAPSVFKPAAVCTQSPMRFGGCRAEAMRAQYAM